MSPRSDADPIRFVLSRPLTAAVKQYWPSYRLDFEVEDGRAVRVLDVDTDGQVFGTGTRVP